MFAGTDPLKLQDLITDAKLNPFSTNFHDGFLAAVRAVQDEIETTIRDNGVAGQPLFFTGHSLGGALALISAQMALKSRLPAPAPRPVEKAAPVPEAAAHPLVDELFATVDPEAPDYERHPRFRGVETFEATLAPGETLFIPHGWWHHIRTLEDAVSMNFWYGGRVIWLLSLASTAFKRLRSIRQDEWA